MSGLKGPPFHRRERSTVTRPRCPGDVAFHTLSAARNNNTIEVCRKRSYRARFCQLPVGASTKRSTEHAS